MNERELKYMSNTYGIIICLALSIHVVMAILFLYLGQEGLAWYNGAIVLFYVAMVCLVFMKHYKLLTLLVHIEVCEFVIGHTILLGWDYGFVFYIFAMTTLMYFNPFKLKYATFILAGAEIIIYLLLAAFTMNAEPLVVIGEQAGLEQIFALVNASGCFLLIVVGGVAAEISTHRIKEYQHQFTHDRLTGIYRREYFLEKVAQTLKREQDKEFYLLTTNIFEFKIFNELFGAKKGDEVLKTQAKMLEQINKPLVIYGRLSGDEFGVLIPEEIYDESKVEERVHYVQNLFSDRHYRMKVYVGVYKVGDRNETVESMCEKTKIAMESVVGQYEKCVAKYDSKMFEKLMDERKLIGEFTDAIADGQFRMYLQPQMISDGKMIGAEALVRWQHPDRGLVPPGMFIPLFERVGLICEVDMFVWEQAAKRLKHWKEIGREDLYISVNISAKEFEYLDLYKIFTELVERYDISPRNLKLEITETAMMDDLEGKLQLFSRLQEYGFEIEIDDFGSGYSSLNMLKEISADVLKLDMGFLSETENKGRAQMIIRSIISLSEELGMRVIAEGVEKHEQINYLSEMGCGMFQGYYFSKPVDESSFEEKYLSM